MSIYSINGHNLHIHEDGREGRTAALLIHGWSSSWFAMSPLVPLLSERYRSLAIDLPGYGESPPLEERASIDGYADILAALIQEITDKPAVLVGHSMGGMISLALTLKHPELVERLVLLCPTISGQLSTYINLFVSPITIIERFRLLGKIVSLLEPQFMGITDRLMRPASFAQRTGISESDYEHLRDDARSPGQGRVRAECYWAMRESDLRGKIGQIEVPSLVIWGMEDNTVPLRDAGAVAREWPNADLRIIPNAGHWPQFETPEVTERYVRAFLSTPTKLLKLEF